VNGSRLWIEWGRLTRFLESARIALARERSTWTSLELVNADAARISVPMGDGGKYKVDLDDHLAAVADEEILMASILLHTYALAENAAAEKLEAEPLDMGGIEDWGARLLESSGSNWEAVEGGLASAVAMAVTRNAYAHGELRIDARGAKRLAAAGVDWEQGKAVRLDYRTLRTYRKNLRSLLGESGLG